MKEVHRVAKNTVYLYAKMAVTVFISLYVTRLILDALGEQDFGIYTLVAGIISMLVFLNSTMTISTQRYISFSLGQGTQSKVKTIFNVSIVLHLIIGLVVIILIEAIGLYLFENTLNIPSDRLESAKIVFHLMVLNTFISILTTPYDAVIFARENMFFMAIIGIIEALLKLSIALAITYTKHDQLISYGFLTTVLFLIIFLVKKIYCNIQYQETQIQVRKYFDRNVFNDISKFASWSFLGSSTSMLSQYGQGIVLNIFFGPIINAAHGISFQINGQLNAVSHTMMRVLNPVITKSEGAGNRKMMLDASIFGSKIAFLLSVLFFTPFLIEMEYIFNLWLNKIPEHTFIFCKLLFYTTLINQLFSPFYGAISAVGSIKYFQIYYSILNLLPLPISYFLFSLGYPPFYLYIAFLVHSIVYSVILLYFTKRECNLSIPFFLTNNLYRCTIVFLLLYYSVSFLSSFIYTDFTRLCFVFVLHLILFTIFSFFIGFSNSERKKIIDFFVIIKSNISWLNS